MCEREVYSVCIVESVKWRYTWAFVTIKGGSSLGEDVGRNVSQNKWGTPVNIHVNVPLYSQDCMCNLIGQFLCNYVIACWADTPINRRRRLFCSKYEGYKEICDCNSNLHLSTGVPLVNRYIDR